MLAQQAGWARKTQTQEKESALAGFGRTQMEKAARVLTDAVRGLHLRARRCPAIFPTGFPYIAHHWQTTGPAAPRRYGQGISFPELAMPRLPRGPRPASSATEDRKAIEQRARDAALPFAPEKKGQWPFPIEDMDSASEANGSQQGHSASDIQAAGDQRHVSNRDGADQSVHSGQADQ